MKLKNLQIENYRSIENLSIDFHQQLNVFVGANGAGKSTILDAVATSLSHLIRRIENPNRTGFQISLEDIRNGSDFSSIACSIEEEKTLYKWKVAKANKGSKMIRTRYPQLNQLVDHFQKELKEKKQLPVVCSYPISREVEKINPKVDNNGVGDIFKTYENALDGRRDYKRFFEWYRNQEDIVNQEAALQDYLFKVKVDEILQNVKSILKINEEILSYNGVVDIMSELLIKPFDNYRNDNKPRQIFYDLGNLISHTNQIENEETILSYLIDIYKSLEVINRKFQDIDKDHEIRKIENKVKQTFKDLVSFSIDLSNNENIIRLQWELLIVTVNLILWKTSEKSRKDIKKIIEKVRKEEESVDFLYSEFIRVFRKNNESHVANLNSQEVEFIKKTLENFLPDYTNMRVERKVNKPQMLIDKKGQTFSMEQLSDGEKNLIALVGDIARRFAIAYPNSEDPLKENGIILIDEVDLHLHPAWQRLVIPKLVETFPNCQFFISTHSPQVISHVKHWSLFLLKNEDNKLHLESATESFGKTSDRILVDLLGVSERPEEIKDWVSETYNLIEENNLSEAQQKVEELEKLLPGDPEWSKMNVLIKRRKILGK